MLESTIREKPDQMQGEGQGSDAGARAPLFRYENGRLYFSRRTERAIFFVLTVVMLAWGLLEGVNVIGVGG